MTNSYSGHLARLLREVEAIARRSGDGVLESLSDAVGELKADNTLVTAIDRRLELQIRGDLERLEPGFAFLGEEFGSHGDASEIWIVDPIDGTNNLVHGVPLWGVSIGLVIGGVPSLGVFHMPATRETFTAVLGGGAFCNGVPIRARTLTPLHAHDCLGITSVAARLLDLRRVQGYLRLLGSIASEVVYTARGSLYATISLGDKLVDMGAAALIATEAGCEMRYLSGRQFRISDWMAAPPPDEPMFVGPEWAVEELRERLS